MSIINSNSAKPITRAWLGFGVVLLCSILLAKLILETTFYKPTFRSLAVKALSVHTQTIALGTCHVFYGLNPEYYSTPLVGLSSYNVDYPTAFKIYKANNNRAPNSKLVLIELDFGMLLMNAHADPGAFGERDLAELGYYESFTAQTWITQFDTVVHKLIYPYITQRLTPRDLLATTQTNNPYASAEVMDRYPGYVATALTIRQIPPTTTWVQRSLQHIKPEHYPNNAKAFFEMITYLRSQGKRVALIRLPRHPDLIKQIPSEYEGYVAQTLAKTQQLWPDIAFYDFTHAPDMNDYDFRDGDHLNSSGARKLAERIDPLIKQLIQ